VSGAVRVIRAIRACCCCYAEDQITHEIGLEDVHDPQTGLDIFKVGPRALLQQLYQL
jgi:hypothetical protein